MQVTYPHFYLHLGLLKSKKKLLSLYPNRRMKTWLSIWTLIQVYSYLIERFDYPRTQDQKKKAIERAIKRLGEKDYKFYSSNCELFAT